MALVPGCVAEKLVAKVEVRLSYVSIIALIGRIFASGLTLLGLRVVSIPSINARADRERTHSSIQRGQVHGQKVPVSS